MPIAVESDIERIIAAEATELIGTPSAHHSRFSTKIYLPELGEHSRFHQTNEEAAFLRRFAGLNWKENYFTYLDEAHFSHSPETGLDCSGLANIAVERAFDRLGIKAEVPRHVRDFYSWLLMKFVPTSPESLVPGTFLFSHFVSGRAPPDHIGIYDGDGSVIHSPGIDGAKVEKVNLESYTSRTGLRPFYGGLVAAKRLLI